MGGTDFGSLCGVRGVSPKCFHKYWRGGFVRFVCKNREIYKSNKNIRKKYTFFQKCGRSSFGRINLRFVYVSRIFLLLAFIVLEITTFIRTDRARYTLYSRKLFLLPVLPVLFNESIIPLCVTVKKKE